MSSRNVEKPKNSQNPSIRKLVSFSLKRTALTAPYWTNIFQTFKYFLAARQNSLSRNPVTGFHYQNLRFDVRPIDWYIMESIFLQREYAMIQDLFEGRTPETIIDAGANIGLFSIYSLSLWPRARVYAIEASPETYAVLKHNQEQNADLHWDSYQYALWEQTGEVAFETEGLSIGWHVSPDAEKTKVPAIRLDDFIDCQLKGEERISLLKLDIEGSEEAALRVCPEILERVDTLLIEIHPELCDQEAVVNILRCHFPYLYDVSTPNSYYPLFLACRWPVTALAFKPVK